MQDLHPHHIDLWLAFPEKILDAQLLERYRLLLSDAERIQERRFHFPKDQHRYLITRALVRTRLSQYAPIAPQDWTFSVNVFGKPHITNADSIAKKISFNISHTHGAIVLGIACDRPMGVDVENICARKAPIEVADSYFSENEAAAIFDAPSEKQSDIFFHYWTLKEAYIKARGTGLSIPLDQFSFHFRQDDVHPNIAFNSSEDASHSRWRFWQFQVSADYVVAVCADWGDRAKLTVNACKVVPAVQEWKLACTLLRESA